MSQENRTYFITPNYSVAFNAKVGSSTLSRAIIRDFHPVQEDVIQNVAYPEGRPPAIAPSQFLCPRESEPSRPVVLVVREPVDRFRSAMAQVGLADVDAALHSLETGSDLEQPLGIRPLSKNVHFRHQHSLAYPSARVYRLDDLDAAASYIGLSLPLPVINEAQREKPTLTADQTARVLAYYAADKALFDSVQPGGTNYSYSPPPPPPEPPSPVPDSITATQIRLWLVRNGISLGQVSAAISAIPDPQARAEAEVQWEYAPYVVRNNPLVGMIAAGFAMSAAAVDQAFREAAQL